MSSTPDNDPVDFEDFILIGITAFLAGFFILVLRRFIRPPISNSRHTTDATSGPFSASAEEEMNEVGGAARTGIRSGNCTAGPSGYVKKDGLLRKYRATMLNNTEEDIIQAAETYCRSIGLSSLCRTMTKPTAVAGELMPLLIVAIRASSIVSPPSSSSSSATKNGVSATTVATATAISHLSTLSTPIVVLHMDDNTPDASMSSSFPLSAAPVALYGPLESARDALLSSSASISLPLKSNFPPRHRILGATTAAGRIAIVRQLGGNCVKQTFVVDFEEGVRSELGRFGFRNVIVRENGL
mmetsp:Transcript_4300/g.8350  ORF Transcript_4300/g.8350 Transcript_4300/m.8350 type:complete len:299 (-) Transcript_4300:509-1405(-)